MEVYNTNNIGNIMYLDDVSSPTLSASLTASQVVSVDARFSITLDGASSCTSYIVQVTNCNPFLSYNKVLVADNPAFESSWVQLTRFDTNGFAYSIGFYRLVRIVNTGGFEAGVKAYVFSEKQIPSIH